MGCLEEAEAVGRAVVLTYFLPAACAMSQILAVSNLAAVNGGTQLRHPLQRALLEWTDRTPE